MTMPTRLAGVPINLKSLGCLSATWLGGGGACLGAGVWVAPNACRRLSSARADQHGVAWLRSHPRRASSAASVSSHLFMDASAQVLPAPNALILEHMDGGRRLYTDHVRREDGHVIRPERTGIGLDHSPQVLVRLKG
jgi:hypothetical protein